MKNVLHKLPFLIKQELQTSTKKYMSICKNIIELVKVFVYAEAMFATPQEAVIISRPIKVQILKLIKSAINFKSRNLCI